MSATPLGQPLADIVLVLHFAVVLFVVGGLVLILAGNLIGWRWVNSRWFRLLHLAAIAIVVAEAWLGITCPLTTLEIWLRAQSGAGIAANYGERSSGTGCSGCCFTQRRPGCLCWLTRCLARSSLPCGFAFRRSSGGVSSADAVPVRESVSSGSFSVNALLNWG